MSTLLSSSTTTNYSNLENNTNTTASTLIGIRIVTVTCMILIDISAFLGNLLVICAFFRTRRLQTVTNYFIASLAFADALVAIFVLPLSIYYYERDRSWALGLILCDLWASSDVLLCTSSILNLACISVDRYMAITKPLTYTAYRSKFLARVMILLVWIVSVVITCPPIFGWRDKNRRETVEQGHRCELNSARGYVIYSALGSFYIPGVVMVFVYIRIFMVVYDRENLIKKFHNTSTNNNNHSSPIATKSPQNGIINNTEISNNEEKISKCSSCYFLCFRKKTPENQSLRPSVPHYTYAACPIIEQKQNGYLVYRFTNNNNNNNNTNPVYSSYTNLPVHKPLSNSKMSLSCGPRKSSPKKLSNISDEIFQYRRNYLPQIPPEYQFCNEESPCYELKTIEKSTIPLTKCRSRSFEHTSTSKIRDLNTELSHSRQLKAAAVAAAAVVSTTKTNQQNPIQQENEFEHLILPNQTTNSSNRFLSITDNSRQTTQSLNELAQLSVLRTTPKYRKTSSQHLNVLPMRMRSTTNPANSTENVCSSTSYPYLMKPKHSIPEPTRINRRIKSSRTINTSPTAMLRENFKQQHRVTRNPSIRSSQSLKSISSIQHFKHLNENYNENNRTHIYSFCCCCCKTSSSTNHLSQNITKQIFNYTPNQSLTNDDDDDEKISSTDTSNRTSTYTPIPSSTLPRVSANSNGAPGDVHRRERIRFMKEQKTAKTLAVVVGGFVLLWLPFFIMYVIPQDIYAFNTQTITLITWLGYFNSVINPFIYAYCSKHFRMAFWNITFGLCIKKSSALIPIANKNRQLHQHHINS